MAQIKFNVFTKVKKTADGKEFKVRLTRNQYNVTFEVRFVDDCDNKNLLPKTNEPFVLVCDTKSISMTTKKVYSRDGEKTFIKKLIYVRSIEAIEEYVEPEFDAKVFERVDNSDFENADNLPF